ncbi:MAG: hypothetical protein IJ137_01420 [Eubacterium sp.]|nr:hypothetical protein [Eubacterium sp.]
MSALRRYHLGERVPGPESSEIIRLAQGIAEIAAKAAHSTEAVSSQNSSSTSSASVINDKKILEEFIHASRGMTLDYDEFLRHLNVLMDKLDISNNELARFMGFDPSHISRILSGKRRLNHVTEFVNLFSNYIAKKCNSLSQRSTLIQIIGRPESDFESESKCFQSIFQWIITGQITEKEDSIYGFLNALNDFDLNEYTRAIHFDSLKVPTVPFQLPTSRIYSSLPEMMNAELDFLKAAVLSKSMKDVTMYSDMPMEEMSKDPEFPKKWMLGMAMLLKKGIHLNIIHNIDRPFQEMMLGLTSYIPMYMTGLISPYYLRDRQNDTFLHFLRVSGTVALSGEAIAGHQGDGRYYLSKKAEDIRYYQKRADQLLAKARPLMKIYRKDQQRNLDEFLEKERRKEGNRRFILSGLPLASIPGSVLQSICRKNNVNSELMTVISHHLESSRQAMDDMQKGGSVTMELTKLSEEEFRAYPPSLNLADLFIEQKIYYDYEDYLKHYETTFKMAENHDRLVLKENKSALFRNIQIMIKEGRFVLVSKADSPTIHFVITHPKMLKAFENLIV